MSDKTPYLGATVRSKLTDNEDFTILDESGAVDQEAISVLEKLKKYNSKENSELYEVIKERQLNKAVNKALKNNDQNVLSYIRGDISREANLTSVERLEDVGNFFSIKGRIFVFAGNPDSGKTNFALLTAYLWRNAVDGHIMTNMDSVKEFETVKDFSELEKKAEDYDRWLYILEDASNHLSGYNVDRDAVEQKIRPFKNELAKNGGNLILMGHTGVDIHPDVRRNAYLVDKESKKSVKIKKFKHNGSIDNNVIKSYNNVPKSPIKYNSNEKTRFTIEMDDETNNEVDKEIEFLSESEIIENKIIEKLKNDQKVETVDIPHRNKDVADVMRKLAYANESLKFDGRSPKSIKRKVT